MDRVSAFLPGWEVPKLRPDIFAQGKALPAVVLARCLEELRDVSYAGAIQDGLEFGGNLTGRDQRAARATAEGLVKLICPTTEGSTTIGSTAEGHSAANLPEEVLLWAGWLGLEMRLRVRAQQRRLQPGEFPEGNFRFRLEGDSE